MPGLPEPPRCVLCRRRPVDPAFRPFCSQRCKLIDLARWVDGSYGVPGDPVDPEPPPEAEHPNRS